MRWRTSRKSETSRKRRQVLSSRALKGCAKGVRQSVTPGTDKEARSCSVRAAGKNALASEVARGE